MEQKHCTRETGGLQGKEGAVRVCGCVLGSIHENLVVVSSSSSINPNNQNVEVQTFVICTT